MKKTWIFLIIFIALGSVAVYLILSDEERTTIGATEFTFEDTASITKIFIADMTGDRVTLQRKKGSWKVNGQQPINTGRKDVLLRTLKKMEMKRPVPVSARDNVIKDISSNGVKVEIYGNGEKAKTLYVGSQTPDEMGTYMAFKGQEPYIVHIPGFNGYLSTRFFAQSEEWISKSLLRYNPAKIEYAGINYPDSQENSFTLFTGKGYEFFLEGEGKSRKSLEGESKGNAMRFMLELKDKQYERKLKETEEIVLDSLMKTNPWAILKVKAGNRDEQILKFYPIDPGIISPEVPEEHRVVENYFVLDSQRADEVFIMQEGLMRKIFGKYREFDPTI